jgi:hypothetical protein
MSKAEYLRKWKAANKKHVANYQKEYSAKWYRANLEKYLLYQVRARAKKLGLPFNLSLDDIQIPEVCPILGIPLARNEGKLGPAHNSPSVDRVIPELGYVKGNVQIISTRANVMKNDASPEELRKFAAWVNQSTLLSTTYTDSLQMETAGALIQKT